MKRYYLQFIFLFTLIIAVGCNATKKLSATKQWYKGNLHTHSYWSDGDEFPEVITDWYKSNNYQFLALSDHNTLAEGIKWKVVPKDTLHQTAFNNYLRKYGADWVSYKRDSLNRIVVKLKTYEEYKGLYEEKGKFLIIQSEEISDHFGSKPIHMNATNIKNKIEPQGGSSVLEVLQNNLNAILKQRNDLNVPMIAHINHPNFAYAISLEDMIALKNEKYFEVYNGHHLVHNSGDSTHISTETMWDLINIAHVNNNVPLVYGLATDDSHDYHVKGRKWSNAGRGWIVVRADSLHTHALIDAMENGHFYASTGVELHDVKVTTNDLSVKIKQEAGVTYTITFIGCKKGRSVPEVLKTTMGTQASYRITDDLLFVRCKITSSKLHANPIEDLLYESAWTQPVLGL